MLEIQAFPYIPGRAHGILSRDPAQAGAIVVLAAPTLPSAARPSGIVVVDGAPFSHPMLGLLARGVPTVIVSAAQAGRLGDGRYVWLDGARGLICDARPDDTEPAAAPAPPAGARLATADGASVALRASVRDAAGAALARERGAESIGLVRSEFLTPEDGRVPDRAYYREAFAALAAAASPLPVTVRLLDVAPDKRPPWLAATAGAEVAFGAQGVRLLRAGPLRGVVDAQIDALADLSAHLALRVLVPFVTHGQEAAHWRDRLRARIAAPIGVMAETPAAALDLAALCGSADFAALGTNDLMQCLFGADRDRPALRDYLDPYAPVLYRFLAQAAHAAGPHLPDVQVCGLLAQLPGVLPLLLGLGYRVYSVDAGMIPWLAAVVRGTRVTDAARLVERVCGVAHGAAVRALLQRDLDLWS